MHLRAVRHKERFRPALARSRPPRSAFRRKQCDHAAQSGRDRSRRRHPRRAKRERTRNRGGQHHRRSPRSQDARYEHGRAGCTTCPLAQPRSAGRPRSRCVHLHRCTHLFPTRPERETLLGLRDRERRNVPVHGVCAPPTRSEPDLPPQPRRGRDSSGREQLSERV